MALSPLSTAEPSGAVLPVPPMIEAERLTKVYGDRPAIEEVSFTVGRGEILGLLGPNGAGKTTTMRILACYTPATRGRARIAGHDVGRDSLRARRRLGYMPENAPLYDSMTVEAYLRFFAEIKGYGGRLTRRLVDRAVEECGLGEVRRRLIAELSKGFRQRVGLAQAVLGDPPVMILDEPTVGLDPRQITEVRRLIREMAGHRTVLLSTHLLQEVGLLCQQVVVMDRGRVVAAGTPDSLAPRAPSDFWIEATIEGDPARAQELLGRVAGVARVELARRDSDRLATFRLAAAAGRDCRGEVARAVVAGGFGLVRLDSAGQSLEDIFLRVISPPDGG